MGKRKVLLGGAILLSLVVGAVGYLPSLGERYLRGYFGPGFSIGDLEVGFRGIRAKRVILKDSRGKLVLKVQRILLVPDVAAFLRGELIVDQVRVQSVFFRVEKLKGGRILFPGGEVLKISHPNKKGGSAPSRSGLSIKIRRLVIRKGSLLFVDHSVSPPLQMRVGGVDLNLKGVEYPFQEGRLLSEIYKVLPSKMMRKEER